MTALYPQLVAYLTKHTLLWPSETDSPVEAVRLGPMAMARYKPDADGLSAVGTLLLSQESPEAFDTWAGLFRILVSLPLSAYRRPTGNPAEIELVIVTKEGSDFVGVGAKLIET